MSKKELFVCKLRRFRRRWYTTPAERLQHRYDAKLFSLIGNPNKDLYWELYMLTPKQAEAKGLI